MGMVFTGRVAPAPKTATAPEPVAVPKPVPAPKPVAKPVAKPVPAARTENVVIARTTRVAPAPMRSMARVASRPTGCGSCGGAR